MDKAIALSKKTLWIDVRGFQKEDSHAEFKGSFSLDKGKEVRLIISCDSDYAFYLNGSLVSFSSFPDYPSHRVADEALMEGKAGLNRFVIITYYCGSSGFSSYCPGPSGLIYEIKDGDDLLCHSGEKTLSRLSKCYVSGAKKAITPQLRHRRRYI